MRARRVVVLAFLALAAGFGIAMAPSILSAQQRNSLRGPGASVAPTRAITAGAGLTGGGDLSANRTIDVGAGSGITVAADSIAVDTTTIATKAYAGAAGSSGFVEVGAADVSTGADWATLLTKTVLTHPVILEWKDTYGAGTGKILGASATLGEQYAWLAVSVANDGKVSVHAAAFPSSTSSANNVRFRIKIDGSVVSGTWNSYCNADRNLFGAIPMAAGN